MLPDAVAAAGNSAGEPRARLGRGATGLANSSPRMIGRPLRPTTTLAVRRLGQRGIDAFPAEVLRRGDAAIDDVLEGLDVVPAWTEGPLRRLWATINKWAGVRCRSIRVVMKVLSVCAVVVLAFMGQSPALKEWTSLIRNTSAEESRRTGSQKVTSGCPVARAPQLFRPA